MILYGLKNISSECILWILFENKHHLCKELNHEIPNEMVVDKLKPVKLLFQREIISINPIRIKMNHVI